MNPKENKDSKEMPFLDHLEELRIRIIKSLASVLIFTIMSFFFSSQLLELLKKPGDSLKHPVNYQVITPAGEIMVRMEISLIAGISLSIIFIFYQFWKFISPGLLPKERKFLLPGLIATVFCFSLGVLFAYKILIPPTLAVFYSTATVDINPNLPDYVHFILQIILVSGLIFELPVIAYILTRVGILTPRFLSKSRRYSIVLIFIIAAVLTPPDVGSQILMAIPLLVLYEVSIIVSRIASARRNASELNDL
jgi:sec-independent protein translocase protein TatC